ncbi:hypothetical protein [Promicromonospora soli]|uniref:Uncharacterized protein n=1 Tax=Promicromonospora soli TaxID=2035533 RepID=A0A919G3D3_9MICO|nr:hypothetical protein [Promicromonospora soli]GHH77285.1 hypothetical protein GCM10017772_37880 [Promicromonospora soli]
MINNLLIAGIRDWVMLDKVTWEVMQGDLSEESRTATLRTLELLYTDGLMVPGDLAESGLRDWPGSVAAWLVRSREELERLGRKPPTTTRTRGSPETTPSATCDTVEHLGYDVGCEALNEQGLQWAVPRRGDLLHGRPSAWTGPRTPHPGRRHHLR